MAKESLLEIGGFFVVFFRRVVLEAEAYSCVRCKHSHVVELKPILGEGPVPEDETPLSIDYWAICPETSLPIFFHNADTVIPHPPVHLKII